MRTLAGPTLVVLAAVVVFIPFLRHGPSCGHDFDFHMQSWVEVAQDWRNLNWDNPGWHNLNWDNLGGPNETPYPHWAQSPNWGAGEPRFLFYPPLTWLLGAAIGSLVGWNAAAPTFIWLLLSATGLAVRALTRQWFEDFTATLAGLIAIFSGYTLFTAFERSAFGELAGGLWIPLVLLFALRQRKAAQPTLLRRTFDGSTLPLALVITGAWLTNAPTGVMACYLLAFVAVTAAVAERHLWPILRAGIAVPLGLGAAAFYLVPAAVEQRWIDVAEATSIGMRIEDSWLFAHHTAPDLQFHDQVLRTASILVVTLLSLTIFGCVIAHLRGKLSGLTRGALCTFAVLPFLVLLLQFPFSGWLWSSLPKLNFLQFPWRLLLLIEAPFALFLAAATTCSRRWMRACVAATWGLIFLAILALSTHAFYQACDANDSVASQLASITSGAGVVGTDEYAPPDGDNSLVATSLPDGCLVDDPTTQLGANSPDTTPVWDPEQDSCEATFTATLWQPEHKRLTAITDDDDGILILRLRAYPAWHITLNGHPVSHLLHRDDGLIALPIPAGSNEIAIDWTSTSDVYWGRWLTALSLLVLGALFWFERKLGLNVSSTKIS